jgi:glutathione synthase/RimK-type ligase-like ATP-grasp enzyme
MRVLLSEGSGLTSRQVATRLGQLGHEVEVLSSSALCLSRFTRHVSRIHPVPNFGADPHGWFEAANAVAAARSIDVLFPTQEQVTVLSARRDELHAATVAPPFESLLRVQDKVSAYESLAQIGLPQPAAVVARRLDQVSQRLGFPVFVKRPISTASSGVRRAATRAEFEVAATSLGIGTTPILIQSQVAGPLAMVQAIADRGRLIARHANLRVREGIAGGASIKESIALPALDAPLCRLVSELNWHGPLSLDVVIGAEGPVVIDVNPRLVEPINAHLAGVDLVGAMLALADHRSPPPQAAGRVGVRTRQLLLAVLGAAEQSVSRAAVATEWMQAIRGAGPYANATEELTPTRGDSIAAVPVLVALAMTLASPSAWKLFHADAVGSYALTPAAWDAILARAAVACS